MVIALLTDFGQSEYVGIMKGIIATLSTNTQVLDITHSVQPQSVLSAAWLLKNSYYYFPEGTIFVIVVDPGVGTPRKALCIKTEHYFFIGPDNGVLSVAESDSISKILDIPLNKSLSTSAKLSKTFHGRDIFAPAGALLAKKGWKWCDTKWKAVNVDDIKTINLKPDQKNNITTGKVVHIDHFGNVISNITQQYLQKSSSVQKIRIKNFKGEITHQLSLPVFKTYSDANQLTSEFIVIIGSNNTLEISIPNGNANRKLGVEIGWNIEII